jgi:hypothetical protein
MDPTKFANRSGFGSTISLPGQLAPNPDMNHGSQIFTLESFEVAGGLSNSASQDSKGVHIRLRLAELPDLFIMLNIDAADAKAFAAALAGEANKRPFGTRS